LLGIKRYQLVSNAECGGQVVNLLTIQARRLALFGHIASLHDSADAKKILTVLTPED